MRKLEKNYARAWQLSSTILLSLAIASTVWLVSVISFLIFFSQLKFSHTSNDSIIALSSILTLIVFTLFLFSKWKSTGSSALYKTELIVGSLAIFTVGAYAFYSYVLDGRPFSMAASLEDIIIIFIAIYISCTATLIALAGFLGLLSNPRIKEKQNTDYRN